MTALAPFRDRLPDVGEKGDPWLFPGAAPRAVPVGALVAECVALPVRPTVLIEAAGTGALRRLVLRGAAATGILAELTTAAGPAALTVPLPETGARAVGLALGWDGAGLTLAAAPGGVGRLGAPQAAAPLPFALDDGGAALILGTAAGFWAHPSVTWRALCAAPFRAFPAALVAPATPIDTPAGPRRADALRPGDAVLTPDGPARLAAAVPRHLPCRGTLAPVRLRAGYCPIARDIVLGPRQAVLADGFGVEDATGRDDILIRAADLAGTRLAARIEGPPTRPMLSLALDRPGLIRAGGLVLAAAGPLPQPCATPAEAAAILRRYRHRAVTR